MREVAHFFVQVIRTLLVDAWLRTCVWLPTISGAVAIAIVLGAQASEKAPIVDVDLDLVIGGGALIGFLVCAPTRWTWDRRLTIAGVSSAVATAIALYARTAGETDWQPYLYLWALGLVGIAVAEQRCQTHGLRRRRDLVVMGVSLSAMSSSTLVLIAGWPPGTLVVAPDAEVDEAMAALVLIVAIISSVAPTYRLLRHAIRGQQPNDRLSPSEAVVSALPVLMAGTYAGVMVGQPEFGSVVGLAGGALSVLVWRIAVWTERIQPNPPLAGLLIPVTALIVAVHALFHPLPGYTALENLVGVAVAAGFGTYFTGKWWLAIQPKGSF